MLGIFVDLQRRFVCWIPPPTHNKISPAGLMNITKARRANLFSNFVYNLKFKNVRENPRKNIHKFLHCVPPPHGY